MGLQHSFRVTHHRGVFTAFKLHGKLSGTRSSGVRKLVQILKSTSSQVPDVNTKVLLKLVEMLFVLSFLPSKRMNTSPGH